MSTQCDRSGAAEIVTVPDTRTAVERLRDLPLGTEVQAAALGQLMEVIQVAWKARDTDGRAGYERAWYTGILDAFSVLEFDAGADEAREAMGWAVRRFKACMDAVLADQVTS